MKSLLFRRQVIIRILATAIVCVLLPASAARAQTTAPNPLQDLREFLSTAIRVQQRHSEALMADPDIVGTAVGLTANGQPAIKVFSKSGAIMRIPANLEGLPVEVEATGAFRALAADNNGAVPKATRPPTNPTATFPRPVPIGTSTGNEKECSAGTLGARVKDSQGNVYALSNNHVYALENRALPNSSIMQPGLADTQCHFTSGNAIGTLVSFVPIEFSTSANNTVDAAIAASDVSLLGNATPRKGYGTPDSAIVSAFVGQQVQKYGETTRLTQGQVIGINANVRVDYDSGTARYINQIMVGSKKLFIKEGDSGALLVTKRGLNPVGLLFAGDSRGRTAVANPIDLVLNAFSVSIDGREKASSIAPIKLRSR
jgi:hypothetical protein